MTFFINGIIYSSSSLMYNQTIKNDFHSSDMLHEHHFSI